MISIELILATIIVNIILFFSILVKVIYKLLPSSCFTTIHGGDSKKKANPKKISWYYLSKNPSIFEIDTKQTQIYLRKKAKDIDNYL